ncbi:MAG TPA: trypsin-like serine protease [Polyangiaceae bacterium]
MRSLDVRVVCFAACLALAGCGGDEGEANVGSSSLCIFGGTRSSEYLHLSELEENAIAWLGVEDPDLDDLGTCSGTLISPRWALTAAHCRVSERTRISAGFGAEPCPSVERDGGRRASAVRFVPHATLDVLLFELDAEVPDGIAVPLPLDRESSLREGQTVEIAGAGLNEAGAVGPVSFAMEELVAVRSETADVTGRGLSGACAGDSGGPLLVRDQRDAVVVAGVLSRGDASCTGIDRYVRTSVLVEWVDSVIEERPDAH